MIFNVSVLSPPGDELARGFAEIAETYFHGLRALGHTAILTENHLRDDATNIVFGLNKVARLAPVSLPANVVVVNLEQYFPDSLWFTPSILESIGDRVVWDYCAENVAALSRLGLRHLSLVPIGSAPELRRIPHLEQDIDVLHYGWLSPRRRTVLERMPALGLRVKALSGVFGEERDRYVARAKLIVQVRATPNYRIFEIVRASYLMINAKVVLSEWDPETYIEQDIASGVCLAPYDKLAEVAASLCRDAKEREGIESRARAVMDRRPQAAYLAAAIRALPSELLRTTA